MPRRIQPVIGAVGSVLFSVAGTLVWGMRGLEQSVQEQSYSHLETIHGHTLLTIGIRPVFTFHGWPYLLLALIWGVGWLLVGMGLLERKWMLR